MAEKSFPFGQANSSGGQAAVSQLDWQDMAKMWGGDRVDFQLVNSSYSSTNLPFSTRVVNGRTIELKPGAAWVGGFYYELDAILTLDIEANPTENPRKDTIVVRVDMAKGSANLAVVKGQPSKAPIAPRPQRIAGQRWEMVLHEVTVPAKDGAIILTNCAPYDVPTSISTPWNAPQTAQFQPQGTFLYDLDSNNNDTQFEAFNGRDGYMITRHLGKARTYTPKIVNTGKLPSGILYRGIWRWIAPNTVFFAIDINNTTNTDIKQSGSGPISFTLPVNPSPNIGQAFNGYMLNSGYNGGLPNYVDLKGMSYMSNKTDVVKILYPDPKKLTEGLNYLLTFPRKSSIIFSGVYEAASL
ncbi:MULTISPECIES: hypothetical protein [Streptomyces]|uniref:hypothetical protein n=1 Tax=Streptomyces TaxID=1883 RepID=UPI001E62E437|nr:MULTISPECIES: hypothetical protein [Streptomyces]UFQ16418.1 hypothetical protein J2N69_16195 [Streptomyces huasconensis]WCL86021.1 hypothetical protein PPN52_16200 [Streptomyces sp. JCM 35825]